MKKKTKTTMADLNNEKKEPIVIDNTSNVITWLERGIKLIKEYGIGRIVIGALLIGISRKAASEFTFILAIPVMLGASLLELLDFGFQLSGTEIVILLVGMLSAFLVSIFVIKFLLSYIRKHDFKVFGWYRIGLGIIVLLCGFIGII